MATNRRLPWRVVTPPRAYHPGPPGQFVLKAADLSEL
jgi:hypothetical protein